MKSKSLFWGHTSQSSGLTSGSMLWDDCQRGLGNYMGCWGSNLGHLCARKYPSCCTVILFLNLKIYTAFFLVSEEEEIVFYKYQQTRCDRCGRKAAYFGGPFGDSAHQGFLQPPSAERLLLTDPKQPCSRLQETHVVNLPQPSSCHLLCDFGLVT